VTRASRIAAKAKKRRSDERGATMLVVLTVIAILSAVGAYAFSNSLYEVRTAGYVRDRSVSEQVTGVGGMAASAELGAAPAAYVGRMRMTPTTLEQCTANGGLGATGPASALPPCYHLYLQDVQNRTGLTFFQVESPAYAPALGTTVVPGSLGVSMMNGGFWVEMTDPIQVTRPVPGAPIDGSPGTPRFIDVTVTSNGVVFQDLLGGTIGVIDPSERASATYTVGRGHVVVGPIYGPI
jgi:hypothetical protein